MKTFVTGDLHGQYSKFMNALKYTDFNKNTDRLIVLGDLLDRGEEVVELLDVLMQIPNLIFIRGNHDAYWLNLLKNNSIHQVRPNYPGAHLTLNAFKNISNMDPYINFLNTSIPYYFDEQKNLFVHAGIPLLCDSLEGLDIHTFYSNMDILNFCYDHKNDFELIPILSKLYQKIYVGHHPVQLLNPRYKKPQQFLNLWAMDTGACFGGEVYISRV